MSGLMLLGSWAEGGMVVVSWWSWGEEARAHHTPGEAGVAPRRPRLGRGVVKRRDLSSRPGRRKFILLQKEWFVVDLVYIRVRHLGRVRNEIREGRGVVVDDSVLILKAF